METEAKFDVVKCPKCKNDVIIDISKAVDEHAEEYRCPKCMFIFRYIIR